MDERDGSLIRRTARRLSAQPRVETDNSDLKHIGPTFPGAAKTFLVTEEAKPSSMRSGRAAMCLDGPCSKREGEDVYMGRPVSHPPILLANAAGSAARATTCCVVFDYLRENRPEGPAMLHGGVVALRTRATTRLLGVRTPGRPFKSPAAPAPRQQHKDLDQHTAWKKRPTCVSQRTTSFR